jgi:hypothetical protein
MLRSTTPAKKLNLLLNDLIARRDLRSRPRTK